MASEEPIMIYQVDVIDKTTMESKSVSVFARSDIEAYDAIREEYPRSRYTIVDRHTRQEVDLG